MGETAFATALASLAAEGVTAASMETDPTGEQRPIPVIDESSLESFAADLTDAEEATEAETTWVPPFPMTPRKFLENWRSRDPFIFSKISFDTSYERQLGTGILPWRV